MYDTMRSDFRRVEEFARNDRAISTLSSQLCQFLSARIELIDLYPFISYDLPCISYLSYSYICFLVRKNNFCFTINMHFWQTFYILGIFHPSVFLP